jgi:hypothetical protein
MNAATPAVARIVTVFMISGAQAGGTAAATIETMRAATWT